MSLQWGFVNDDLLYSEFGSETEKHSARLCNDVAGVYSDAQTGGFVYQRNQQQMSGNAPGTNEAWNVHRKHSVVIQLKQQVTFRDEASFLSAIPLIPCKDDIVCAAPPCTFSYLQDHQVIGPEIYTIAD